MARPEKVSAVAEIADGLRGAGAVILTEYRGLKVKDLRELRQRLTAAGASYHVYKNTLVRFAAAELEYEGLEDYLVGPTALAFCESDPVAPAKVLAEFARTNPALVMKGSLLQGRLFDADRTKTLADLDSREVLLSKLAGVVQAPLARTVGLMAALISSAARVVAAYRDTLPADDTGDAAAADAEPVADAEPESVADNEAAPATEATPAGDPTPEDAISEPIADETSEEES